MNKPRLTNMSHSRKGWYDIQNKASGPTEVWLYDDIGMFGVSANDFVADLNKISGDVSVHLNSQGGEVFDGLAIYNALAQRTGTVSVTVDALAASIASVIAMAASPGHLSIANNGSMMIHEAHTAGIGNAQDMKKMSDRLDSASNTIASIYSERSGQPAEQWREAMKEETWFSAQEAVAAGLADKILPSRANHMLPGNSAGDTAIQNVTKPHGDVPYADPGYLDADGEQASKSGKEGVARYPIDEEHVVAAWSYINQEKNASQYTSEQLAEIKSKIKSAMKKFGHDVSEDNSLFIQIQATLKEVFA